MTRKPSAYRLAQGLRRIAAVASARSMKLRALGLHDHARAVSAAANALSDAADAAMRSVEVKRETRHDFG